ncbi:MAG: heme-binding protein, partial [Cellvibrionaceae bacterium]|nr:heme-binding protein [Cellvibrionaceae bacterium]
SLGMSLGACGAIGGDIEEAAYELIHADNNIEIRHYHELVLVSAPMVDKQGDNNAFMKLFRYISGDNNGEQKIAMTAPVFMDPQRAEKMSFVLPAKFTIDNAPQPQHKALALEHWQGYTPAAIRFNGRLNRANIDKHQAQLEQWLAQQNITISGAAKIAGYDHPMTLPAWRRNEVLIPVEIKL